MCTIFDPYSPPFGNFLLLSVDKFDQFFTPPTLKCWSLKLKFPKGGFAPSWWKLQCYRYFAVFKECAWFWPLLPSCWNFFATIRRRIWPFFDPYPPKNVDVLIWCSLWKFLHLPVENSSFTNIFLYVTNKLEENETNHNGLPIIESNYYIV